MMTPTCKLTRRRWTIRGQVQGVGLRPFVYRIARELGIGGFVRNDSSCVVIEGQGEAATLDRFIHTLTDSHPQMCRIESAVCESIAVAEEGAFEISHSAADTQHRPVITVDAAVCPDCVRELLDPSNFRYRYPLINCTNCGPRYTIIRAMPYDRGNTTMSGFRLCEKCHQQYANPADRRFHAQPVACGACGPGVELIELNHGDTEARRRTKKCNTVSRAAQLLAAGSIVAIKGIGGFHLACRADSEAAVAELRQRKHRDAKPFAVMCANVEVARGLVRLSIEGERELTSPAAPVVLAPVMQDLGSQISDRVFAGTHRLGVMLPYTPLHHLLFDELSGQVATLVMTSANLTDEPLVKDNQEAIERLAGIADALLVHERDIERSVDDSVVIDMGAGEKVLPVRRARGYVPQTFRMQAKACTPSGLCVGGELKSTVAVVRGDEVIVSHHLGDLKHTLAYGYFQKAIGDLCQLLEVKPQWIAHDMHPGYLSTQWARELGKMWDVPLIPVQHHHAHAAAVLAEHQVMGPALAVVCDGVGYGTDGTAWGGELLQVTDREFQRLGHLRTIRLAGGDAAARDTRRCAAGVLHELGRSIDGLFGPDEQTAVEAMLGSGRNCVTSSAAGRLFDAVAAILNVCSENSHEAQAAMGLEALASRITTKTRSARRYTKEDGVIDLLPLIAELGERKDRGEAVADLAAEFHEEFCRAWAQAVQLASGRTGLRVAGLSGGVFCNEIVTKRLSELLREQGMTVLRHEVVPPNDGGIAFGQAAVAIQRVNDQ